MPHRFLPAHQIGAWRLKLPIRLIVSCCTQRTASISAAAHVSERNRAVAALQKSLDLYTPAAV